MRALSVRVLAACAVCLALLGRHDGVADADERVATAQVAQAARKSVTPRASAPAEVDAHALLKRARVEDEKMWSTLDTGQSVELTIAPELQRHIQQVFARYAVPYAGFVAIEPRSGRVLAYVSHSSAEPGIGDLAGDAGAPAASVFKLVTAAALLESGVSADTRVCYGGGSSGLAPADIVDNPRRDRACASLSQALGSSINAIFGKLALQHVQPRTLERYAHAFGFGERLPSQPRVDVSAIDLPSAPLEYARTAAGFWHTHLSPLHGALMAAAVANGGVMPRARLIERADGIVPEDAATRSEGARRVISAATARTLGQMMQRTVRDGTSREAFRDERGRPRLRDKVAGKTGSLSREGPYRAYSWWVGFAPAEDPSIALGVLVVNSPMWRIKSSFVAREAIERALVATTPRKARRSERPVAKP